MSLLRAALLGGVDGTISSFAVVAGVDAGGWAVRGVLVVGVATTLADALSMGVSEYLSSEAARDDAALAAPAQRRATPLGLGAACFAAFALSGAVPIVAYVASRGSVLSSAMFSLVWLMLLGVGRARVSGEWLLRGLLQTASLGAVAGAVAYGVGVAADAATA